MVSDSNVDDINGLQINAQAVPLIALKQSKTTVKPIDRHPVRTFESVRSSVEGANESFMTPNNALAPVM